MGQGEAQAVNLNDAVAALDEAVRTYATHPSTTNCVAYAEARAVLVDAARRAAQRERDDTQRVG